MLPWGKLQLDCLAGTSLSNLQQPRSEPRSPRAGVKIQLNWIRSSITSRYWLLTHTHWPPHLGATLPPPHSPSLCLPLTQKRTCAGQTKLAQDRLTPLSCQRHWAEAVLYIGPEFSHRCKRALWRCVGWCCPCMSYLKVRWSYLKVSPVSSFFCIWPWRTSPGDRSTEVIAARTTEPEGTSIGGESHEQLLSWCTIVPPILHSIFLPKHE